MRSPISSTPPRPGRRRGGARRVSCPGLLGGDGHRHGVGGAQLDRGLPRGGLHHLPRAVDRHRTRRVVADRHGAANTATDFTDPTGGSTTNSAGGGAGQKTFSDTGIAGTLTGSTGALTATSTPSTAGAAVEGPYDQNPVLAPRSQPRRTVDQVLRLGRLQAISVPGGRHIRNRAPTPATTYPAGATFQDGAATASPATRRTSTTTSPRPHRRSPSSNTLRPAALRQHRDEHVPDHRGIPTSARSIASVDQNMLSHMMGNDPRPHYFHQTNLCRRIGHRPVLRNHRPAAH